MIRHSGFCWNGRRLDESCEGEAEKQPDRFHAQSPLRQSQGAMMVLMRYYLRRFSGKVKD